MQQILRNCLKSNFERDNIFIHPSPHIPVQKIIDKYITGKSLAEFSHGRSTRQRREGRIAHGHVRYIKSAAMRQEEDNRGG